MPGISPTGEKNDGESGWPIFLKSLAPVLEQSSQGTVWYCSGAGLFNQDGQVVGVVTAMLDKSQDDVDLPADVSFATKSGSFYAAVKKHLTIPIRNRSARSRSDVINTATRSSVLVLAIDDLAARSKSYSPFKRSEQAVQRFREIPNDFTLPKKNPFGNWFRLYFSEICADFPDHIKMR